MEEKRIGRQTPTQMFVLPYTDTLGQAAVEMYEQTGRTAQEWQRLLIYDIMAVNEEHLWTHTKAGYSVPRRNGKNEIVAMREMYGLQTGETILHTAHRTSTSRSAWERLTRLLNLAGIHEKKLTEGIEVGYTSGKSKGQEYIIMPDELGGGKIYFRTRTTTGGLGEGFDLLVIDEAQEYQDDQESALKYTVTDSSNPQTIFCGTPPTAYSSGTIFPKFRADCLEGAIDNGYWAEWSVEHESDPTDRDLWYETNPSLGQTLSERAVADEVRGDRMDFNIQRLGLWLRYNQHSAISETEWTSLASETLPKLTGKLFVGIKYGHSGENTAMSVAVKTDDGRIFVEAIDCVNVRQGNAWVINFLSSIDAAAVVVDGANGQGVLAKDMKDAKLKPPTFPTVTNIIQANSSFELAIFNKSITHMNQPSLTQSASNCEKRAIGSNGGFGYRSIREGVEVSLLDSAILAHWACANEKPKKKQKVSC